MKPFVLIVAALGILICNPLFAGSMSDDDTEPCWGPSEACSGGHQPIVFPLRHVISFSIGPAWSHNGQTQTLILQPDIQKKYAATFKSNVFPYGELFFGVEKEVKKGIFTQLGLEVAGGSAARFRGDIWEDADPNFINYTYSYNVNEARIMAKGKLLADVRFYDTRPYVSGGLGVGFNNSYNFNIKPIIYEEVPAPAFKSSVNTVFTYTLGAGFEEVLNEHWHAAIGYEFANWGESQLAAAAGQTVGGGLVVNNIYINSVLLTLIYMC